MPASIGRCADLYHDVRELRLAMEKEVEEVKAREVEVQEHIIRNVSASAEAGGDTGAAGLRYRVQVIKKLKPIIGDWGILCSWVRKNDRFDILQKRISEKAVAEWNETEARIMPGTDIMQVPTLSVTKL